MSGNMGVLCYLGHQGKWVQNRLLLKYPGGGGGAGLPLPTHPPTQITKISSGKKLNLSKEPAI